MSSPGSSLVEVARGPQLPGGRKPGFGCDESHFESESGEGVDETSRHPAVGDVTDDAHP